MRNVIAVPAAITAWLVDVAMWIVAIVLMVALVLSVFTLAAIEKAARGVFDWAIGTESDRRFYRASLAGMQAFTDVINGDD